MAIVPVAIAIWRVRALLQTICCGVVYRWLVAWWEKAAALHRLHRRRLGRSVVRQVAGSKMSVICASSMSYMVSIQRVRPHL
jgi:hypothetical protein